MVTSSSTGQAVLDITEEAAAFVLETRAAEPNPESLALYLEVSGVDEGAYQYDMWFESLADVAPGDAIVETGELRLVVVASSIERVRGATLEINDGALAMSNPNTPPVERDLTGIEIPVSDLSSPLELAVLAILEEEINPQIAAHGGRADLVAVDEEGVAYLRLSGGCQGCGMAAVTLSQGISVAIREGVPEIIDIVDVTAHEAGTNPYFEAAKK